MKLVTKMRKFIERMENVESMSDRQLNKMLLKAENIMKEYIELENKKEKAYNNLKEITKYKSSCKTTQEVSRETIKENKKENNKEDVMDKVAVTIQVEKEKQEYVFDNTYTSTNIDMLNQSRLVITKESKEKGLLIGAYHKDGKTTYFSSSNSFDNPVVFGNASLTKDIKENILKERPDFYKPVTKNFKSIAMFGKSGNNQAMVYLADAKRLVFEGYIGNMVFSTTKEYIDSDYSPLVTRADIFIENGGKHNHVTDNMCTPSLKKFITSLIEQYMISPKFNKAKNDIEYFNKVKKLKDKNSDVNIKPTQVKNLGYGLSDIYAAMKAGSEDAFGGVDYEPEF